LITAHMSFLANARDRAMAGHDWIDWSRSSKGGSQHGITVLDDQRFQTLPTCRAGPAYWVVHEAVTR
jgi:hypothetical protein